MGSLDREREEERKKNQYFKYLFYDFEATVNTYEDGQIRMRTQHIITQVISQLYSKRGCERWYEKIYGRVYGKRERERERKRERAFET